ncbi:MAG: type I-C CRISPR-associated protein Cas5c [Coriobacteriales bacterium]|nr:type I-C CRISPR-associated protein Cas5c [Coriobacteriales bacterium]
MGFGVRILVSGKRACFTRPEMKVERVSYDVITPSAARGIVEAIYWKPAIRWVIDRIVVLNEIQFETFRRNEVGSKLSYRNAKAAMFKSAPVYEAASQDRQQRMTVLLKDVAYIVEAHFELTERAGDSDTKAKHYNMVLRRLRKGQCFSQPCLGCREFAADVKLLEDGEQEPKSFYADAGERDLGFMLYDLDFSNPANPQPLFYRAKMDAGVIEVAKLAEVMTR